MVTDMLVFAIILGGVFIISLPLIKVFQGKTTAQSGKNRLLIHITGFALLLIFTTVALPGVLGVDVTPTDATALEIYKQAAAFGYIGAALSTGFSALGAGIAVAAAAPAAIGAISENPANLGKSLIFVALGEGVAIYGLLISILILNNIPVLV